MRPSSVLALIFSVLLTSGFSARAAEFPGPEPESEFIEFEFEDPIRQQTRQVDMGFCSEWNPDFNFNGRRCCAVFKPGRRHRNWNKCAPTRYKTSYCNERTAEQIAYAAEAAKGRLPDVLESIRHATGRMGEQSFCTVNNGFLARGRELIPSPLNRIVLRSPTRCLNFGTDGMVGLIEWTGRQIAQEYKDPEFAGVHLLVGDIAAPRGGCLWGRGGRRGHASHTTGLDADLGFLTVGAKKESPRSFHRQFDAKANWWMLKKFFSNPFACVKVVFLDRRHIQKLERVARGEPEWDAYRRFIRHVPAHRNHFHIRIGDWPGPAGCVPDAQPELEDEAVSDSETAEN